MALARALTHSPLVILTGAGASVPLGLDTTATFRGRFYDTQIRERMLDQDAEFYKFVLDRLGGPAATDIEVVLARLEAYDDWTDKLASDPIFVETVLHGSVSRIGAYCGWNRKLAEAIYDEVIDHYGHLDAARAAALYRGLLEVLQDQLMERLGMSALPFFTLNYDTAVESACAELDIDVIDGFSTGRFTGRRWDPAAYARYTERPGKLTVALIKLHGSVRLGRSPDGTLVELPTGLRRDPRPNQHAVLYPTLSPKALDEEPFRTNYRFLRSCLSHARLLAVIGCSMRDQELNNLISECMDQNDDLHLVSIAPDAEVEALAQAIGRDTSRLGTAQGYFEIENANDLKSGRGRVLNAIRLWMDSTDQTVAPPRQFGTNSKF